MIVIKALLSLISMTCVSDVTCNINNSGLIESIMVKINKIFM